MAEKLYPYYFLLSRDMISNANAALSRRRKQKRSEVTRRMRIFLAAPLFSEAERDFNSKIAKALRGEGFELWLAQEHKFIERNSLEEKGSIFEEDLEALKKSDLVVAVLDGVDVDSGVAFEMGFAHAQGKPILGLKTDHRVFSKLESVNLMLEMPLITLCNSLDQVVKHLVNRKDPSVQKL